MSFAKRFISATKIVLAVLVLVGATVCLSCSSDNSVRDKELERRIIDSLLEHKNDAVSKIDMNKVLGTEWRKICIQGPYFVKDLFEREIKEKIDGDDGLGVDTEQFNNIWIFYKNNTSKFVQIHRGVVMDRFAADHTLKQALCTTSANPFLYLQRQNGVKKFFFNSDGE